MKTSLVAAVLVLFAAIPALAQAPMAPEPAKEHAWLKQFEGEWETEMEAKDPSGMEFKCKGSMKSRMLGGFWVVNETKGEMMGMTMNGIQTIGFDEKKKKYVGTWVDNCMNHLWKYGGAVEGKGIYFEAEGADFTNPGKMAKFRDSYEFKSPDLIIATSAAQGADGKWTEFVKGTMKRKKP